jgi:hypothetical protein
MRRRSLDEASFSGLKRRETTGPVAHLALGAISAKHFGTVIRTIGSLQHERLCPAVFAVDHSPRALRIQHEADVVAHDARTSISSIGLYPYRYRRS